MPTRNPQFDEEVLTQEDQQVEEPPLYRVLLHNDDYTTMDFVVYVLVNIFHRSENDAIHIMLAVHNQGVGVAGVYTREIAETKINQVHNLARAHEYPLLCTMEEE